VAPLAAQRARALGDAPADLVAALDAVAEREQALDAVRDRELRRLVRGLDERGIRALLIKGAQLAYTHYERSELRSRSDTDVLVASKDRDRTVDALLSLGYVSPGHVDGALVTYQAAFIHGSPDGPFHVVDVHWRVANPQVFADLLTYDELSASAVPVPALGRGAWGLSNPHALLLACVHRVAHHHASDLMHWLYDIHLIAGRMTPAEWSEFVELAEQRGVSRVCWRSLGHAASDFHTMLPASVTGDPHVMRPDVEARTSAYLEGSRRHVQEIADDLRALPTWSDRFRLIAQHAFPSPAYMRTHYAPTSSAPLPVLYARRVLHGARKWLARP